MTSTYTSNLNLEKPATGDQVDTWGPTVNGNMDTIDTNVANKLPLAGGTMTGNLTMSDNEILLSDNGHARFGDSEDLQIYHDGSHSYIEERGTGYLRLLGTDMRLANTANDKDYMTMTDGGAVKATYNGVVKVETTSAGIDVSGNIILDGTVDGVDIQTLNTTAGAALPKAGGTMTGDLKYNDSVQAKFGDGEDLKIYHDGSHTYIHNATGNLGVKADTYRQYNAAGTKTQIAANADGAATLYYNDAAKIATANDGVSVTGTISAGGLNMDDSNKIKLGNSYDLEIFHDGSHSYVHDTGTGDLYLRGTDVRIKSNTDNDDMATFIENGAANLFYSNAKKLETVSGGVTVTGTLSATTLTGNIQGNALTSGQVTTALGFTPPSSDTNTTYSVQDGELSEINFTSADHTKLNGIATSATNVTNTNQLTNGNGFVTSSGVTSVATSNGCTGGTITGSGTISMSGSYSGSFSATGNITAYSSDSRLKDFKGKIDSPLDKIEKLNGYYYEWNDVAKGIDPDAFKDGVEVGVNAQEVEAVLPEVVVEAPIVDIHKLDTDYKTVHYDKLVPLLIEGIKELKAEVDELKKEK